MNLQDSGGAAVTGRHPAVLEIEKLIRERAEALAEIERLREKNRIGARDAITDRMPTLAETDAQINADHAEGREKILLTRATARALYYALYDTLNVSAGRDHDVHDVLRLERLLSWVANIGWPGEGE